MLWARLLWNLQAKTFNIGSIDYDFADRSATAAFLLDQGHQPSRIPRMLPTISVHVPEGSKPAQCLPA